MINLTELKRPELIQLFVALGNKFQSKMTSKEIISLITEKFSADELEEKYTLLKAINQANEINEQISNTQIEQARKPKTFEEVVIEEKRAYNKLAADERKKALELVMCFITTNDERDLSSGANCATISVYNFGGVDIARAVPFNVWCEVERCIAKQARDVTFLKYEESQKGAPKLGRVYLSKKYNVQIQERKDWFRQHNVPFPNTESK